MKTDEPLTAMLSPDELAPLLKTSRNHVLKMARENALPFVRLGNGPRARVRFRREDVQKLIGRAV